MGGGSYLGGKMAAPFSFAFYALVLNESDVIYRQNNHWKALTMTSVHIGFMSSTRQQ